MLAKRFILLLRRKQIKESSRIARRLIAWQGALKFTGALSPTPKHCLRVSSALHRDPAGGKIHKDQMYKCDEDVRFDRLLSDTGLALWNGIKEQAFMAASGLEETVAHVRNRNQDQYWTPHWMSSNPGYLSIGRIGKLRGAWKMGSIFNCSFFNFFFFKEKGLDNNLGSSLKAEGMNSLLGLLPVHPYETKHIYWNGNRSQCQGIGHMYCSLWSEDLLLHVAKVEKIKLEKQYFP